MTEEQQVETAPETPKEEETTVQESPNASAEAAETKETVEEMYANSLLTLQEGQVVTGKVVRVDNDGVLVDVGYKSEGLIPLAELSDEPFTSQKYCGLED